MVQMRLTFDSGWTSREDSTGELHASPLDDPDEDILFWEDVYPVRPPGGATTWASFDKPKRIKGVPLTAAPDGRRLAFVDGHDVGVVSAIGGAPLILTSATRTPAFWSGLAWSPDGTLVAYTQGAGRPWYSVSAAVSGSSEHIDRLQVDRWIQD
jgi:hypothetical protein